jgi:hypothetical protein
MPHVCPNAGLPANRDVILFSSEPSLYIHCILSCKSILRACLDTDYVTVHYVTPRLVAILVWALQELAVQLDTSRVPDHEPSINSTQKFAPREYDAMR